MNLAYKSEHPCYECLVTTRKRCLLCDRLIFTIRTKKGETRPVTKSSIWVKEYIVLSQFIREEDETLSSEENDWAIIKTAYISDDDTPSIWMVFGCDVEQLTDENQAKRALERNGDVLELVFPDTEILECEFYLAWDISEALKGKSSLKQRIKNNKFKRRPQKFSL